MHYETLNEGLALRQRADLLYRLIFRLTNLAFLRARAIPRDNNHFCLILHFTWRLATASLQLEIRQEEPVSCTYVLRGPLHSNSFSWCIIATGKGRDVSLYEGKIWKLTLSISTFLYLCMSSVAKEDRLSSLIVLRRGVFSLFMPLKPCSAAQVGTE